MPKHALISIPLALPAVRVRQTELTTDDELIRTVASTLMRTTCRRGGCTLSAPHGLDQPRVRRQLPMLGRGVAIRLRPTRCRWPVCAAHPTTPPTRAWDDPTARHTNADAR